MISCECSRILIDAHKMVQTARWFISWFIVAFRCSEMVIYAHKLVVTSHHYFLFDFICGCFLVNLFNDSFMDLILS